MPTERLLRAKTEPSAFHTLSGLILSTALRSRCYSHCSHFTNRAPKAWKLIQGQTQLTRSQSIWSHYCREAAPQGCESDLNCRAGSDQTSSITYHPPPPHPAMPSGSCKTPQAPPTAGWREGRGRAQPHSAEHLRSTGWVGLSGLEPVLIQTTLLGSIWTHACV